MRVLSRKELEIVEDLFHFGGLKDALMVLQLARKKHLVWRSKADNLLVVAI